MPTSGGGTGTTVSPGVSLTAITELLPWVALDVSASDDVLTDALKRAGREFLMESEIWEEEIAVTTVVSQAGYTLTVTATDAEIKRIKSAKHDNAYSAAHELSYYLNFSTGKITFETDYIPASVDAMTVTAILQPKFKTANYPSWVLNRWGEKIAMGAVADLLMLKGKPWSDYPLGKEKRKRFLTAISEAKSEAEIKGTQRYKTVRP